MCCKDEEGKSGCCNCDCFGIGDLIAKKVKHIYTQKILLTTILIEFAVLVLFVTYQVNQTVASYRATSIQSVKVDPASSNYPPIPLPVFLLWIGAVTGFSTFNGVDEFFPATQLVRDGAINGVPTLLDSSHIYTVLNLTDSSRNYKIPKAIVINPTMKATVAKAPLNIFLTYQMFVNQTARNLFVPTLFLCVGYRNDPQQLLDACAQSQDGFSINYLEGNKITFVNWDYEHYTALNGDQEDLVTVQPVGSLTFQHQPSLFPAPPGYNQFTGGVELQLTHSAYLRSNEYVAKDAAYFLSSIAAAFSGLNLVYGLADMAQEQIKKRKDERVAKQRSRASLLARASVAVASTTGTGAVPGTVPTSPVWHVSETPASTQPSHVGAQTNGVNAASQQESSVLAVSTIELPAVNLTSSPSAEPLVTSSASAASSDALPLVSSSAISPQLEPSAVVISYDNTATVQAQAASADSTSSVTAS